MAPCPATVTGFMRYACAALSPLLVATSAYSQQLATYCPPGGAGGFVCPAEQEPLPDLTPDRVALIQRTIREQIPAGDGGPLTDAERAAPELEGGNATAEERATKPGSQFEVCERCLSAAGYSHVDYSTACNGLFIRSPFSAARGR